MNELSALCYRAYAIHGKQAVYDELAKQKKLRQKDVKNVVYSFCPECNSEEPHLFGECLICGEIL